MTSSGLGILGGVLTTLLVQAPVLLVWLGGVVAALVLWQRHPTVSLLTIVALGVLALLLVVGDVLNVWLPVTLVEQGVSASQIGGVLGVIGFMLALIQAAAWALLLVTLFRWRDGTAASRPEGPPG